MGLVDTELEMGLCCSVGTEKDSSRFKPESEGHRLDQEEELGKEVGSAEACLAPHLPGSSGLLMAPERQGSQAFGSLSCHWLRPVPGEKGQAPR